MIAHNSGNLVDIVWVSCYVFFFFFKQKTAYEMCGRDWSSDVCSSDLNLFLAFVGFTGFIAGTTVTIIKLVEKLSAHSQEGSCPT